MVDDQDEDRVAAGPDGPFPRTLQEAVPYVGWVILALGFGLEFVNALTHIELFRAGVSFAGLVGLMTALLHWRRINSWISRTNPNFVFLAFALLLFAIVLSPFIEQRQWPFLPTSSTSWPSDSRLRSERDRYKQELDDKNDSLESVKRQLAAVAHAPASSADTPTWLRLRFDEKGNPAEVASTNVHWSWLSVPELPIYDLDFIEWFGSPKPVVMMTTLLFYHSMLQYDWERHQYTLPLRFRDWSPLRDQVIET